MAFSDLAIWKRVEITSTTVASSIAFSNSSPFFAAAAGSMAANVIGWLNSRAKSAAVFPSLPFSVLSAFSCSIRNLAVAVLLSIAANIRAVYPLSFCALTSAPFSCKYPTSSVLPFAAAYIIAVVPSLRFAFASAPLVTRNLDILVWLP